MNAPVVGQPRIRVNAERGSVSVCGIAELTGLLERCEQACSLLKSVFRVTTAQAPSAEDDNLPDVSGRYLLRHDELEFIPSLPFDRDLKYQAIFDPAVVGSDQTGDALTREFLIASEATASAPTDVTHIFPSSDHLPENLLRFYVCFSNSMQRGNAVKEISLLDSDGRPVADALYRPPVELWDRTMRRLTVLLDPGRLKRWVGPNQELGPPLKAGQGYILEIGAGMVDHDGRSLRERRRKYFDVGAPVRQRVATENWEVVSPLTGGREPLVLVFPGALDWALLLRMITIESGDGLAIDGRVVIDQAERRWNFTPAEPWSTGLYHIRVACDLEDVCGNSISGEFDRPIQKDADRVARTHNSFLAFQPIP